MRDGSEQDIDVTLGNLNDFDKQQQANAEQQRSEQPAATPSSLAALGLTLEQNPDGDGVRVAERRRGQPGGRQGPRRPATSSSPSARKSVNSVADVEKGIASAQDRGRDAVLFRVQGENGTRFVGVPFERG